MFIDIAALVAYKSVPSYKMFYIGSFIIKTIKESIHSKVPYLERLPKSMYLFPKKNRKLYARVSGQEKLEWKKLLGDPNIPYRKLYATRHTFIVSMLKHSNLSILEIAQMVGHTSTQMIIQNYGKFIKGEHLKIAREIKLFTDKSTDNIA